MERLTGTFREMGWEERAYDDVAGQPPLMRAVATHELSGDIQGEASISYLLGRAPDGAMRFIGLARVTGRVAERDGSFVMQGAGALENGVANGRWTILPGFGSGELASIRGDGQFASAPGDASSYLLDVEL